MPPAIRHRFVPFGTRFESRSGVRSPDSSNAPCDLHTNEIAVDVGGVCWGYHTQLPVLDHHFLRDTGNYPSAAAAVLHNAARLHAHFENSHAPCIWVVTHASPDFDALCSAYLAAKAIAGEFQPLDLPSLRLHPDGWLDFSDKLTRFDWYKLPLRFIPPAHAWAFLLASLASLEDNCRPMQCPLSRRLSYLLYSRMERGYNYEGEEGATAFFNSARAAMEKYRLNPLIDSVLEYDPEFDPDRLYLDRAYDAYPRDLRRARKTTVRLPVVPDFERFFRHVSTRPLQVAGVTDPDQTDMTRHNQTFRQADGVYLRDPESSLFHRIARADGENSSLGRGFTFTAIAYSNQSHGPNPTRYIFSLDPENAAGAHLYPLWARIQAAELEARRRLEPLPALEARPHFAERAGAEPGYFHDPWFDAPNYRATLVENAARGSRLAGGVARDLSDDAVANLAREVLEASVFVHEGQATDFGADGKPASSPFSLFPLTVRPLAPDSFRMVEIAFSEGIGEVKGEALSQMARLLWPALHPEHGNGEPPAIIDSQTVAGQFWVGVWSERGIAVAYRPEIVGTVESMRRGMEELTSLTRETRKLLDSPELGTARDLMQRVSKLQWQVAQPGNRLLEKFFEASRFTQVLSLVHDTHASKAAEGHLGQIVELQRHTELLEIFIVSVYATELAHVIAGDALHEVWPYLAVGYFGVAALGRVCWCMGYLDFETTLQCGPKNRKRAKIVGVCGFWRRGFC